MISFILPTISSRGTTPALPLLSLACFHNLSLALALSPSATFRKKTGEHGCHSDICWLALHLCCLQTSGLGGDHPAHPWVHVLLNAWPSCGLASVLLLPLLSCSQLQKDHGPWSLTRVCVLALVLTNWVILAKS